jgi:hypothetical protein
LTICAASRSSARDTRTGEDVIAWACSQRPQDGDEHTHALALGLGLELDGGAAQASGDRVPGRRDPTFCAGDETSRR